jgi:hypothetical protein
LIPFQYDGLQDEKKDKQEHRAYFGEEVTGRATEDTIWPDSLHRMFYPWTLSILYQIDFERKASQLTVSQQFAPD